LTAESWTLTLANPGAIYGELSKLAACGPRRFPLTGEDGPVYDEQDIWLTATRYQGDLYQVAIIEVILALWSQPP
jgi:hypothetical protein